MRWCALTVAEAFPGPKGRYSTILRIIETEHLTVRQLNGRLAAGWALHLVGTPSRSPIIWRTGLSMKEPMALT